MPPSKPNRARIPLFLALLILLLAALAWHFGGAAVQMLTPLSERYRREGDALLAEGHLAEAVLTYRQAVEADSENRQAMESLANAYEQQGRQRMAERYRARLINRQPVYSLPPDSAGSGLTPTWITAISEATPLGGALSGRLFVSTHEDGTLAAVDVETGAMLWSRRLPAGLTSAPDADHNLVVAGGSDGDLYALAVTTGKDVWQMQTGGAVYAAPVIAGEVVFCSSSSGKLLALRAADGQILWERDLGSPLHGSVGVGESIVFVGSSSGRLYAVNIEDGSPAWPDGVMTGGAVESQPQVSGNRVIFGSGDGRVYALDAISGGQYWRASTPDAVYASPLALGERIIVASSGRSLSAIDLINGKRIWQAAIPSPLHQPPALAGRHLYQIGEADPRIYVVDLETGSQTAAIHSGDWLAAGPWTAVTSRPLLLALGRDGALIAYAITEAE